MEHRESDRRCVVACYREFAPHPALQGRVRALFSFSARAEPTPPPRRVTFEICFAAGDRYSSPLFADGNASIVFDLGASVHANGVWRESSVGNCGKVIGPMRRVAADFRRELPAMVGAYFHPAGASAFVRMPCSELTDQIVAIDDVWGSPALDLSARFAALAECERLDLLEDALLAHMGEPRETRTTLDIPGLAATIVGRRGQVTIDALAAMAGVSRQHLTRVFRERVGVTPKLYCRLARFQSALLHARAGDGVDWARVAGELGYADQSQMIAEFREFSSLTPRMLAMEHWFHPFIERAKMAARVTAPRVTR